MMFSRVDYTYAFLRKAINRSAMLISAANVLEATHMYALAYLFF